MTAPPSIADLATLAAALDDPETIDSLPPAQWRSLREMADTLAATFANVGGVTVGVVLAVTYGASLEANIAAATNPMAGVLARLTSPDPEPSSLTMIVCAFLARDVLAGERVP